MYSGYSVKKSWAHHASDMPQTAVAPAGKSHTTRPERRPVEHLFSSSTTRPGFHPVHRRPTHRGAGVVAGDRRLAHPSLDCRTSGQTGALCKRPAAVSLDRGRQVSRLDGGANVDLADLDVAGLLDGEGHRAGDRRRRDAHRVHVLARLLADVRICHGVGEIGADVSR